MLWNSFNRKHLCYCSSDWRGCLYSVGALVCQYFSMAVSSTPDRTTVVVGWFSLGRFYTKNGYMLYCLSATYLWLDTNISNADLSDKACAGIVHNVNLSPICNRNCKKWRENLKLQPHRPHAVIKMRFPWHGAQCYLVLQRCLILLWWTTFCRYARHRSVIYCIPTMK